MALVPAAGAFAPAAAAAAAPGAGAFPVPSGPGYHEHQGPGGERDVNVCSTAVAPDVAHCFARVRTDPGATGASPWRHATVPGATQGNGGFYDPSFLQSAYDVASLAATNGVGQTVAVVDAYDDPNAAADMGAYRSAFGLPSCGTGCFTKVDEYGSTSSTPSPDSGWALEISLDLDMVSAICPNCHILLVEAYSATYADLGTAVDTAVSMGASVVSNSYGGSEFSTETSYDTYYDHPGRAIVVASGDNSYGVEYPAASSDVTSVGGTSLHQATNTGTRTPGSGTETAWSGAGSGCSAYEPKPSWQHDAGCARRTVADVSAVADPNTGVWVYDTYGYSGMVGGVGGTSVATPIVGAIYALAGNPTSSSTTLASLPYADPAALNDVVSGSNGSCGGSYLCTAGPGYDGPTGLGTPNGTAAFSGCSSTTGPCAPSGLTATAGNNSVSLSWTAPAPNSFTVTGYDVYRATSPGAEGTSPYATLGTTATTYTDTGAADGTTWYYTVTAVSGATQGPPSNEASATPMAVPGAPTGLSAAAGNGRVTLSWSAPSGGTAATGYKVYRSTSTGTETYLATVGTPTTGYVDSAVTNGTTYYYKVTALAGSVEGPASNEASAKPVGPPGAPGKLRASTSSRHHGVTLSWNAPSSNGGSTITGYQLWRGTSSGGESALVNVSCSSSSCSYSDTTTTSGQRYYYEVLATNVVGPGPLSNEVSATAR
ncbi:MAG TPA: fibronectin type III domain-containing protein [Acidimicrobiales bacterium]|nr:fibronectin type III domain-containing protein [Acidimicrobiales bacterium]